jgi:hypothetical protein
MNISTLTIHHIKTTTNPTSSMNTDFDPTIIIQKYSQRALRLLSIDEVEVSTATVRDYIVERVKLFNSVFSEHELIQKMHQILVLEANCALAFKFEHNSLINNYNNSKNRYVIVWFWAKRNATGNVYLIRYSKVELYFDDEDVELMCRDNNSDNKNKALLVKSVTQAISNLVWQRAVGVRQVSEKRVSIKEVKRKDGGYCLVYLNLDNYIFIIGINNFLQW